MKRVSMASAAAASVVSLVLATVVVVGGAAPASGYCAGFGAPSSITAAQGKETVQASEPCNGNGNYGGRAMDVQVGDGQCTYVYYRNLGSGTAGWVQGTGCSTSSWTNYGAFGSAYEIRTCIGATGVCSSWRGHSGF